MSETISNPIALVAEPIADRPRAHLAEHTTLIECAQHHPDFAHHLANAHALIVRTATRVDRALLAAAPNLRVIGRAGVGLDTIDLAACAERGIHVVYTPGANADAVAEYTISMLIRAIRPIDTYTQIGPPTDSPTDLSYNWEPARAAAVSERSISQETIGIIGLGAVGSRVARAAGALNATVLYTDLADITEPDRAGATPTDLPDLLARSSVVSIHVDDRPQNANLINASTLNQLKPNAVLINTSRGFVVNEPDLARFAAAHHAARVILDVHAREPFDPTDALAQLPNVTRTPHIAAATTSAKEAMSWVVTDVIHVLQGRKPDHPAPEFRS